MTTKRVMVILKTVEHKMVVQQIPVDHRFVLATLNYHGYEAYIVGGAVRDLLIGQTPKDFDIATDALPHEVAELFPGTELVGAHFGVSLVKTQNYTIEVATYRIDGKYSDGRRPDDVKLTTQALEDVVRRDFTINALLLGLDGNVVDYVEGQSDLFKGMLRAVGDPFERIKEDPVRILRAVRFAAKLNFQLDPLLSAAMYHCRNLLSRVAPERITKELSGILLSGRAALGVSLLNQLDLLHFIAPALEELQATPQNPKYHPEGDVMTHTLGLLRHMDLVVTLNDIDKDKALLLMLGALFHDIGKPRTFKFDDDMQPTFHGHEDVGAIMTDSIMRSLRFSNEIRETVVQLVAQHMRFRVLEDMRKAKQLRFVRQPNFDLLLELHRADALAGSGNLANYEYAVKLLAETPPEVIHPKPLISGSDLINLGAEPGPKFKDVLSRLETHQLEGTITTRAKALQFAAGFLGLPCPEESE